MFYVILNEVKNLLNMASFTVDPSSSITRLRMTEGWAYGDI